mmetsp:Transcript_6032/g.14724  ORF Transcript_6032/g.14724 Transcript_6032/m.14724 type:complete len:938 (+) Transcript_6032:50-2863(+)
MPESEPSTEALSVGQRVVVLGKRKGTVRFVGSTAFGPGEWVGVELDKPTGSHDGGAHGHRYFTCPAGHGVYVQRQGVLPVNSWQAAANQIQSMLRGRKDRQETDYKRAFHTWNQMEMGDESDYLNQTATISRVENMLRTYHPASTPMPNGNSAVSMSKAAGVSITPLDWGEDMQVEASYTGPHLKFPLTLANVQQVLHHIRTKPYELIHRKYVCQLVGRSVDLFNKLLKNSVYDMAVPDTPDGKLVICGDTHGQLADFLWVLKQNGEPSPENGYLLNGDIADRGENAVEILVITLMYKQLYPANVSINRGNHENIEMNRRGADHGGGFFDEVKSKYDANVFMMFSQLFEVLPIATVVQKKVFVVHGGLFRRDSVLVQHLRTLNRRRQCPTSTDTIEDSLLFDCMWSDPWDFHGVAKAAHRGQNCIRFGPDVTRRFLGNNSLSLCIRSHEVPQSLRGFEDRHDGRLITVFTASNYCGQTGNFGAVVIFHSDMSYTVEEHMAPTLDDLVDEYTAESEGRQSQTAGVSSSADAPAPQHTAAHMEKHKEKMEDDLLSKLDKKILMHKDDLWWYWEHVDPDGTGKVSAAVWRHGMASALQLDLPWFNLQKSLVQVDKDGNVNYKEFLDRCKPKMEEDSKLVESGWDQKIIKNVYESLLSADMNLKELMALFDQDGDGVVTPQEFKHAIMTANIQIPETQINALLRAIDRDSSGKLKVSAFLDRFQVVYSRAADQGLSSIETEEHRRIKGLLSKVGTGLLAGKSRVEVFEKMDINKDGFISREEFYEACNQLAHEVSGEDRTAMWNYVDANGDGHLNYFEFCAAFQVVDMSDGEGGAVTEIVEVIVSALQKNMSSLEFAFRFFDQKGVGNVSVDDFKAGLRALNSAVTAGPPLTDAQLDVLVEFVDQDHDGRVDYEEFLKAFKLNPTTTRFSEEKKTGSMRAK